MKPPNDVFSEASVATQLDNCTYCPKMCRHACPVSGVSGHETHTPQAKMGQLSQLRRGRADWNPAQTGPLWACTGCRHCTTYCDHDSEPGLTLFAGRGQAVARGAGHPALAGYSDRFRRRDERLAAQLREQFPDEATAWDRGAAPGTTGFLPGCDTVGKGPGDIAAAMAVFGAIDEDVQLIAGKQVCAGYPLLAAGYPDLLGWHARKVAETLRPYQRVITNCSACLYTMRAQYRSLGVQLPEIVSLVEFLAERRRRLPAPSRKRPVYYHDPCYHARYAGIVEAPRLLLHQVADVRELSWCKTDTECCGGGGLLPKTDPTTADGMARRRLAEVQGAGGGTVVTSCGTCAFMLRSNAPSAVVVDDLASAIADLADINVPTTTAPLAIDDD